MDDVRVPEPAAAQLAYHLRMAAAFAAADDPIESASAATLAWTIFAMFDPLAAARTPDLPGASVVATGPDRWNDLHRRTSALALELQGHFVSEGQHDTADIYARAAGAVGDAMSELRNAR
jgi:hypothetical protein